MKPEFNTNEGLSSVSCQAHLLAEALLTYADDEGYFNAHPGLVRAGTCPLRADFENISALLAELVAIDYIRLGTGSDGKKYGRIVHFCDHQKISHPAPSKINKIEIMWDGPRNPPEDSREIPENSGEVPELSWNPHEILRPEQGTGNREQGTGNGEQGTGNRDHKNTSSNSTLLDGEFALCFDIRPKDAVAAVARVFEHYLNKTGKNPKLYTLTPLRANKGRARLEEALSKSEGNLHDAIELMLAAVDELVASDWHMGRHPKTNGKKYCDWERNLFGNAEQFEKWLQKAEQGARIG